MLGCDCLAMIEGAGMLGCDCWAMIEIWQKLRPVY
jgi:hypothetical protein